jgi:hypothetical protein
MYSEDTIFPILILQKQSDFIIKCSLMTTKKELSLNLKLKVQFFITQLWSDWEFSCMCLMHTVFELLQ